METFQSYPKAGRELLGPVRGANCRHEYGLKFMQITGQTRCAYCDMDFSGSYENWLQMVLDHVVPVSVCESLKIQKDWTHDYANRVLACAACNGFGNRYKAAEGVGCPATPGAFFELRDIIFEERKILIAERHEVERAFFERRLWESAALIE